MARRNSIFFAPATLLAMIGVSAYAAYAAIPDAKPSSQLDVPHRLVNGPNLTINGLRLAWAPDEVVAVPSAAPTVLAVNAIQPFQSSQPAAPPSEPSSLPQGQVPPPPPAPVFSEAAPNVGDNKMALAEIDCTRNRRATSPLTLDQLTALMQHVIQTAGPNASVELIHELLQASLDRSHDDPTLKNRAVTMLLAAYPVGAKPQAALSGPFNLLDNGSGFPNGYDPCGNPTSITSGGAFSSGPFSTNFSTINPIPTIASKSGKTGETVPAI